LERKYNLLQTTTFCIKKRKRKKEKNEKRKKEKKKSQNCILTGESRAIPLRSPWDRNYRASGRAPAAPEASAAVWGDVGEVGADPPKAAGP